MRKYIIIALVLALVYPFSVFAATNSAVRSGALPTTSTFGAGTLGSYTGGSPSVFVVDTLTYDSAIDTGETRNGLSVATGGLLQAIEWDQTRKMILFEVSGTIVCDDRIELVGSNVAFYGQTAPSPGIFLRGLTLITAGNDNVVFQHLRIGAYNTSTTADNVDAMYVAGTVGDNATEIVIDHCTFLWSIDGLLDLNYVTNVTVSNCIIGQALDDSLHSKRQHSTGGIINYVTNGLYYGNLYIHNDFRNPVIQFGSVASFINNWVVNPGDFSAQAAGEYHFIMDSNIIQAGDDSHGSISNTWFAFRKDPNVASEVWFVGNVSNDETQDDANDYTGVRESGATVYDNEGGDGGQFEIDFKAASADAILVDGVTAETVVATIKGNIASNVGARPQDRIAIEGTLITNAEDATGRIVDSVPAWPTVSEANSPRNLSTGMAADGQLAIPSSITADTATYGTASDGRYDIMEWIGSRWALRYNGVD